MLRKIFKKINNPNNTFVIINVFYTIVVLIAVKVEKLFPCTCYLKGCVNLAKNILIYSFSYKYLLIYSYKYLAKKLINI